jgi:hypothetical protein
MNKHQKDTIKLVNSAYIKLSTLNNINWTPYREELFNMNLKDEKQHRKAFGGEVREYEAPMADCARLFVVKHIAEALIKPNRYTIKDTLHIKKSCIQAQALVENYEHRIIEAWHIFDFQLLADLDYILLIDYQHYLENIERMKAYNQIEPVSLNA